MGHGKKLKKKLKKLVMGCGCLIAVTAIAVFVFFGSETGVLGRLVDTMRNVGINIPREIALPPELGIPLSIKVPQLPVNPFKLSQQQQIALGNKVASSQNLDQQATNDPTVQKISARLVKALPVKYRGHNAPRDWAWTFRIATSKNGAVNAIALPGGRVYVSDGLVDMTGGDANQLAAVIGHEMAHVVEEHSAEQLRNAGLIKAATDALLRNAGSEGGQQDMITVLAAQTGEQLTTMQLSQAAEYQADDLGFKFMSAAGYDPTAGLKVFEKLGKLSGGKKGLLSGVFSTHPPTAKRIEKLRAKMPTYKPADGGVR